MTPTKNRSLYIEKDITWVWTGARLVAQDTPGVSDLPLLLARIARLAERGRQTEVTVLVAGDMATAIGLPARPPRRDPQAHPVLELARSQRWRVTKLAPWTSFRHVTEDVAIHMGFAEWLSPRTFALMGGQSHGVAGDDPGSLVYLLSRYQDLTGAAFRATPGVSASALLESIWQSARPPRGLPPGSPASPFWHPDWSTVEPARSHTTERPYSHWSPVRDGAARVACLEGCPGFGTGGDWRSFDGFRNYLAAAATVETAFSELQPRPMSEFDRRMSGYWQITMPHWNEARLPHPITGNVEPGDRTWVTTPTLDLVRELSEMKNPCIEMPAVHRAYVAKRGPEGKPYLNTRRVLREWAGRINRAADSALIQEHSPAEGRLLEDVIKAGYKEAFGMWLNDTGRVWRPDWSHSVTALARCNGFRKMWRAAMAGHWPVHIHVDEITYEVPDDNPDFVPPGFRIDRALGAFKTPRDNPGIIMVTP